MFDIQSKVFAELKEAVKDICPNAGMSGKGTPSVFPYLSVATFANETAAEDLENQETAVRSVIEIRAYSNEDQDQADAIMSTAGDCMREMGFGRTGPFTLEEPAEAGICRVIYRFDRIIGVGEEI